MTSLRWPQQKIWNNYDYHNTGWPRRWRICPYSDRVQHWPLYPWRLNVVHRWNEVQRKVRFWVMRTMLSFSPRDKDLDGSSRNCAFLKRGGGWFSSCSYAHLTGAHTTSELSDSDGMYINWYYGGDKGNSWMSWKEAKMTLIHKWMLPLAFSFFMKNENEISVYF